MVVSIRRPLGGGSRPVRRAVLGPVVALLCAAGGTAGALAQPRPEPPPALQCPTGDPLCTYSERRLALDGDSYQMMMLSGGADWSTQFWVRDAQGQVLLAIPPLRGTAYLAAQRAEGGSAAPAPAVRVISYHYGPGDPAVAPSGLSSTTYHYDAGSDTLVGDEPDLQPIATPEALRQMLTNEGWTLVFPAE
jgi:hypothetical protein